MSKLNKDILFLIFEELQDFSKSLFSCLLVNKIWCETVIPVLWRNPWRYYINYSNKSYLFAIFISYLPNDVKVSLTSEGIQLLPILHQPLLFDYLSFCKSINANIMSRIISTGASSDYDQFLLQQEFYNILMRKCSELKYLDMGSIKHQIFYLKEAKTRLDSLCELRCDTSTDPVYFHGLASICRYIKKIFITNTNTKVNDGIFKLIEVQKNLRLFHWEDDFDDDNYIELLEDPYSKIFLSLAKHADTLNHFITSFRDDYYDYNYTFMKDLLLKLHKLKTLTFNFTPFSPFLITDYEKQLDIVTYHDLEDIDLDRIAISAATCIIRKSGGCIRKILIYEYYIDDYGDDDDSLNFIRIIYENCPLVEYLSLPIFPSSKDHFNEFEKLLGICQKLRSLYFRDTYRQEIESEYIENLSNVLIRAAPSNIRNIGFGEIVFSLKILEEFLEKWRGRPAISISLNYLNYREASYVNLINKYRNEGVIR